MDWEAIVAGIGAVLTGAGGCALVIHEFRRRDRIGLKAELDEMSSDVSNLRADLVAARRYAFHLAAELANHGYEPPDPPELHR